MYFRVLRGRCLTLSVIVSVSASVYPLNSYRIIRPLLKNVKVSRFDSFTPIQLEKTA